MTSFFSDRFIPPKYMLGTYCVPSPEESVNEFHTMGLDARP